MSIKQEVAKGIVRGVAKLWRCEELQDFTVEVDGVHFGCHRFLLAACSDFFRGLFRSGMQETDQKRVILKDISGETFELIMESMYTGHGVLTKDNVTNIWRASHQLQIQFLMSECENFVMNTLSMENYAQYFYTANTLNSSDVLERLWPFVLKNCNSFFQTNYFLELPMDVVLSLIKSQDLETTSEDDVLNALLKWMEFQSNYGQMSDVAGGGNAHSCEKDNDEENGATDGDRSCSKKFKYCKDISTASGSVDRNVKNDSSSGERNEKLHVANDDIATLLSKSRIGLASQTFLDMLVRHPLIVENKRAKDLVVDAMLYQLQKGKRNGHWPSWSVHRNTGPFLHCIATVAHFEGRNAFVAYSIARKAMFVIKVLENFKNAKLVEVHNEIYAMYNYYGKADVNNLQQYSSPQLGLCLQPLMNNNASASKLIISTPLRSEDVCFAVIDSCVYLFSAHKQSMWKLDAISQQVLRKFSLPGSENIAYLMTYGHCILVFYTSKDKSVDETAVQCYDTLQNTWTEVNYLEGKADGMTSFADDHSTYLLQSNGKLWRVVKPQSNIIDFELVAQIWGCDLALHGAITYLDDLHIGIKSKENLPDNLQLKRSLPGLFKVITYYAINAIEGAMFLPVLLSEKDYGKRPAPDFLHSYIKVL